MKLKFDVELMDMDGETVAVPIGDGAEAFHGILKLNGTGKFILNLLRENTTEETVVDAILQEYTGEREEITDYVRGFVSRLRQEGLLE